MRRKDFQREALKGIVLKKHRTVLWRKSFIYSFHFNDKFRLQTRLSTVISADKLCSELCVSNSCTPKKIERQQKNVHLWMSKAHSFRVHPRHSKAWKEFVDFNYIWTFLRPRKTTKWHQMSPKSVHEMHNRKIVILCLHSLYVAPDSSISQSIGLKAI